MEDTLRALEMGSVEILIVWENLDIVRYMLKNHSLDGKRPRRFAHYFTSRWNVVVSDEKILYLRPEQEKDKTYFTDKETGVELELVDSMPLLEWFANNYKKFGKCAC